MHLRPFKQVDVFTAQAYRGNPLAVVLDGTGLGTEAMQDFTHWTNLSEATFVLPPTAEGRAAGADYRVRIFCPGASCPFRPPHAGHLPRLARSGWSTASSRHRGAGMRRGPGHAAPGRRAPRLCRTPAHQERAAGGRRCSADRTRPGRGAQRHPAPRLVRQRPELARRDAAQRRAGAGPAARRRHPGRAGRGRGRAARKSRRHRQRRP